MLLPRAWPIISAPKSELPCVGPLALVLCVFCQPHKRSHRRVNSGHVVMEPLAWSLIQKSGEQWVVWCIWWKPFLAWFSLGWEICYLLFFVLLHYKTNERAMQGSFVHHIRSNLLSKRWQSQGRGATAFSSQVWLSSHMRACASPVQWISSVRQGYSRHSLIYYCSQLVDEESEPQRMSVTCLILHSW